MLWWTFQNFVTAGLMTGVVALICRFGRIGPVGRHALWLVVLLKLLTPPLVAWPWAVRGPVSRLMPPPPATSIPAIPTVPPVTPPPIEYTTALVEPPLPGDPVICPPAAPGEDPPAAATGPQAPATVVWPDPPCASALPRSAPSPPPLNSLVLVLEWAGRVWLAGGILFAAVHVGRIARMLRLRRRALPPDPSLARRVDELCGRLGLRPVRTRVVAGVYSPLVWCLVRPEMLWPAVLPEAAELSLKGLIVHELAHLKRGDHWVGWLELVAGCVWWWNPLYWYVRHQLRENAELACDAWVVETLPGGRRAYAEALLSVCESMSGVSRRMSRPAAPMPALGVGTGGRRTLERRLAMILRDRIPLRIPKLGWLMIGLLLAGTLPAWSLGPEGTAESEPTLSMNSLRWTATAAEPAAPSLPADAQDLLRNYEQQQARAREEAARREMAQRDQLVKQLRELQDRYTKAGHLDEAVAIRDRVRQLSMGPTGVATVESPGPSGEPVNAAQYRGRIGMQIQLTVTGSTEGYVWGSGVYTDDSTIAAAAVHAGILKPGERGQVFLTILPGQNSYVGDTRNGVTSSSYGVWLGSYELQAPLHSYGPVPARTSVPLPDDPGTLGSYRDRVGKTFEFKVTGSTSGTIWGKGVYTDDSPLAVAAVHAGVLEVGKKGLVRVTILPGQSSYEGGEQNGVTSYPYHSFPGSYRVLPPTGRRGPTPAYGYPRGTRNTLGNVRVLTGEGTLVLGPDGTLVPEAGQPLTELREQAAAAVKADHPLVVMRQVTGTTTGSVWGTDVYTDDSSVAAAAVHAGALKDGETGWVKLTLLTGQSSYSGTTRNGVTSRDWSSFDGSFRVERGSPPQSTLRLVEPPSSGGGGTPAKAEER